MKILWIFGAVLCLLFGCAVAKTEACIMDCNFSVWDNPRQCHGDADGIKQGFYWVSSIDLAILRAVYTYPGGDWPAVWPGSINYDPHADFDRDFRVDNFDFDIIETWLNDPNVPADCGKKLAFESPGPWCLLSNTFYTIRWIWRIYTGHIPVRRWQ